MIISHRMLRSQFQGRIRVQGAYSRARSKSFRAAALHAARLPFPAREIAGSYYRTRELWNFCRRPTNALTFWAMCWRGSSKTFRRRRMWRRIRMMGMISPHGGRTARRRDKKGSKTAMAGRKKRKSEMGRPKLNSVNQKTDRRDRCSWRNNEYHPLAQYPLGGG